MASRRAALVAAQPGLKPTQVMQELAAMWRAHKAAASAVAAVVVDLTGAGAGAEAEADADGAVASLAAAMDGAHIVE